MAICAPPWIWSVRHYVGDMVSHLAWLYVHHHGYGQLGIVLGIWLVILHGYMCSTMAMVSLALCWGYG